MRATIPTLAATALLLALTPASAQDDACTQQTPCDWIATVDAIGFTNEPSGGWNFTAGDWFVLDLFNLDDVAHRLVLEHPGGTFDVGPDARVLTAPFAFDDPGTYSLRDETTGAVATYTILAEDVVDHEDSNSATHAGETGSNGTPGPAVFAVGLAVLGAAFARRT